MQRQGIGRRMMTALLERCGGFHQLMLVADRASLLLALEDCQRRA